MKGFQLGYDQLDNGEKIYLKKSLKYYGKLINKITKQDLPNETSIIKFNKINSSTGSKYALKFKNFFFFKMNQYSYNHHPKKKFKNSTNTNHSQNNSDSETNNIYRFNLEIAKKSKIIKSINFNMTPLITISLNNFFKLKYGNYEGSRNQTILFNNKINNIEYDFSSIFPSMLPYKRLGMTINKNFIHSENFMENFNISYNKIFDYESNLKLSTIVKSFHLFKFGDYFNANFYNEFIIKKSFIFSKKVKINHVFSNYFIKSKLIDMYIEQKNKEINNGNNFYIQNITSIRFNELPILKWFELTKRIYPYVSLESFFIPKYSLNFREFFKFIYNFGFSFNIKDNLFIDFSILTGASKNINIKKKFINSFRIKLSN